MVGGEASVSSGNRYQGKVRREWTAVPATASGLWAGMIPLSVRMATVMPITVDHCKDRSA